MPSVSKKQRRKVGVLHDQGKITDEQWEHFKVVKPKKKKKGK
jgi:hypothetical protein